MVLLSEHLPRKCDSVLLLFGRRMMRDRGDSVLFDSIDPLCSVNTGYNGSSPVGLVSLITELKSCCSVNRVYGETK